MKKKILAITGIRSEIEYLIPILNKLREDNFEIAVVISGAHLSSWHDNSIKDIINNKFRIADRIDSLLNTDRLTQRVKGVGMLTYSLSQTVERERPDFLMVVGDREESISTAIVGNYMRTLVAHVGGGDTVYGHEDDAIRHATSKLSHIHFVLNNIYKDILINMGEEDYRVFNVGSPSLDNIKNEQNITIDEINKQLELNLTNKQYIMMIKHPMLSENINSGEQMKRSLEAVEKFCIQNNLKCIGIYPNTDPGSFEILSVIKQYENSKHIFFYKHLNRNLFVNLLKKSLCLVGNSSLGITEAPFLELPVINIGDRQKGRVNAGNVLFTDYDFDNILSTLNKVCFNTDYRTELTKNKFFYGYGNSCEKISKILNGISLDDKKWYHKKLNYL